LFFLLILFSAFALWSFLQQQHHTPEQLFWSVEGPQDNKGKEQRQR
jgi:hypothetical protein